MNHDIEFCRYLFIHGNKFIDMLDAISIMGCECSVDMSQELLSIYKDALVFYNKYEYDNINKHNNLFAVLLAAKGIKNGKTKESKEY